MLNKSNLRIVFIGTPDFAVCSLSAILQAGYRVVGVITAPDRPAGRGQKLQESVVKKFALAHELPILQPTNLKSPEFLNQLRAWKADIQVVIAFRMLPEAVWNMPPMGTFNLHASLLPAYRGAAPINRAIMNGEEYTGVTTFFLKHEIDTGPISFQAATPIGVDEDAGSLHDRLMEMGAKLVVETLDSVIEGCIPQIPQEESEELPTAPKLFREDMELHPHWPVKQVFNHIRGLSPYPGAFTFFRDKQIKLFKATVISSEKPKSTGKWEIRDSHRLLWHCSDGVLEIEDLQMEGKRRMKTEEFLRGLK